MGRHQCKPARFNGLRQISAQQINMYSRNKIIRQVKIIERYTPNKDWIECY